MLTVIALLGAAFGMAVFSALFPLVSVEIFVVGVVLNSPVLPWWLLAVVVAVGQIIGKLLYYYAARGLIRMPSFMQPERRVGSGGRWSGRLEQFRSSCRSRPVWSGGLLLISAATSLPPFLATCVVAGWARIPLMTFLITGLVGRFLRFGALAVAPSALIAWA